MMNEWEYHSFAQPIKATFRDWDSSGTILRGLRHRWIIGYHLRPADEGFDLLYIDHSGQEIDEIPSSLYEWIDNPEARAGSYTRVTPQAFTDLKEL